ncbi:Heme/hemopexin transporter protein HuxB [bioreactor metagenome]|uniref:Heme/hemopexin transporter protein HuxB n=1 Tax=bioreactor metagenome TaxID=1076179 RepID=A0A644TFP5_9ZZZZ
MKAKNLTAGLIIPLTILCLNSSALAQNMPPAGYNPSGAELKQAGDTFEYYRLSEKVESKPSAEDSVIDKTAQQTEQSPAGMARVFISRIAVDVSDILTAGEIQAITATYENREISISELNEAVSKINELYKKKNYITAKAVLPQQTIKDGVVRIQLVEGRLGELQLSGNQYTRNMFVFDRLNLAKGSLVRLDSLEQQLTHFNMTNDLRLRAELKPGAEFGTTDIVLIAEEPENEQFFLFSDNAGSKNTGRYRYGFSWTNRSLTGNRDIISLTPVWSEGTFAGSFSYSAPVNNKGRLEISYNRNRIDILSGPYAGLNIEGYSSDLGLSYNWNQDVRAGFKTEHSFQLNAKDSETLFDGSKLFDTDVKTFGYGYTLQANSSKKAVYVRHDITRGYADSVGQKQNLIKYNLSSVRQQALADGVTQTLRLSGQLTPDKNLPTVEQFSLGGMSSVRGYEEGLLLGDKGYFLSAEWSKPLSEKSTGFIFIDHGGAFPYKGNNESIDSDDFLTSFGMGITHKFLSEQTVKLALGLPLQHQNDNSPRLHFIWQSIL